MKKIKILIADDHCLIRDGIRALLSHVKDLDIIGEAEDGKEAVEKTAELNPNVVLMDIAMPLVTGIEATRIISKKYPKTKVLVLTQHEKEEYVHAILSSGGSGYLLKNTKKEDFINAIRVVAEGRQYFSNKISDIIMQQYINKDEVKKRDSNRDNIPLTIREIEIISLIAEEFSNRDVADKLNISLRTVETHRRNIMRKLKINNAIGLAKYAAKKGLIAKRTVT